MVDGRLHTVRPQRVDNQQPLERRHCGRRTRGRRAGGGGGGCCDRHDGNGEIELAARVRQEDAPRLCSAVPKRKGTRTMNKKQEKTGGRKVSNQQQQTSSDLLVGEGEQRLERRKGFEQRAQLWRAVLRHPRGQHHAAAARAETSLGARGKRRGGMRGTAFGLIVVFVVAARCRCRGRGGPRSGRGCGRAARGEELPLARAELPGKGRVDQVHRKHRPV